MAQEKDNQNQKEGIVTEALPNTTFRVQLNGGEEILTHLAGE